MQRGYNMNNQFVGLRQKFDFTAHKWNNSNNLFIDWQQECFDIKDNLYNQFFIITSTDSWTFHTFHPSLHESVATQCEQNKGSVIHSLFYRKEVKAIRFCLSLVFFNTWNAWSEIWLTDPENILTKWEEYYKSTSAIFLWIYQQSCEIDIAIFFIVVPKLLLLLLLYEAKFS